MKQRIFFSFSNLLHIKYSCGIISECTEPEVQNLGHPARAETTGGDHGQDSDTNAANTSEGDHTQECGTNAAGTSVGDHAQDSDTNAGDSHLKFYIYCYLCLLFSLLKIYQHFFTLRIPPIHETQQQLSFTFCTIFLTSLSKI